MLIQIYSKSVVVFLELREMQHLFPLSWGDDAHYARAVGDWREGVYITGITEEQYRSEHGHSSGAYALRESERHGYTNQFAMGRKMFGEHIHIDGPFKAEFEEEFITKDDKTAIMVKLTSFLGFPQPVEPRKRRTKSDINPVIQQETIQPVPREDVGEQARIHEDFIENVPLQPTETIQPVPRQENLQQARLRKDMYQNVPISPIEPVRRDQPSLEFDQPVIPDDAMARLQDEEVYLRQPAIPRRIIPNIPENSNLDVAAVAELKTLVVELNGLLALHPNILVSLKDERQLVLEEKIIIYEEI